MAKTESKKKKKTVKGVSVPHANQYLLDPRQLLCWNAYIDPKSPTFSNALQSALSAGYPESTSRQITTEHWWCEKVRRLGMLSKAERNLEEALDLPLKTQAMGPFGPLFEMIQKKVKLKNGKTKMRNVKGEPIMTYNLGLANLRTSTAEFVAERVGKARYSRKEGDEGNVYNVVIFTDGRRQKIAQRVIRGGSVSGAGSEEKSD